MTGETKITGGRVLYGLTLSPKQYESKRADVELTFSVAEDDSYEEVFDRASAAVVRRVKEILDKPAPEPKPTPNQVPPKKDSLFGDS